VVVSGGGVGALHHELAEHPDVVLHAQGGWVPLPPSPCLPGVVHWRVKPAMCGWELPRLDEVTDAVLAALDAGAPAPSKVSTASSTNDGRVS
jgi:hypothetical protein